MLNVGLSSGFFEEGTSLEVAARRTRDLGLDQLAVAVPGPVPGAPREAVRAVGVSVCAVVLGETGATDDAFDRRRAPAVAAAAQLRAGSVVVEGGDLGPQASRALRHAEATLLAARRKGETLDVTDALALRRAERERAAERAARALHRALGDGPPLAIRNGGRASDLLLHPDEVEWLLGDLPVLGLWFDPARALRAWRLGLGPEPAAWADRLASRTTGVFVQGLGSDLAGHGHPEDGAADWGTLGRSLPHRVPWVLDVSHTLSAADVDDAIRYLRSAVGE